MYPSKNNLKKRFSAREIKIMQKAKAYDIDFLSSEVLCSELFNLSFYKDLDTTVMKNLVILYGTCEEAVSIAQMSS